MTADSGPAADDEDLAADAEHDIVADWQAIVDGAARTQQRVLGRVEETGLPGVWFEALYTLLHADEHRLPMNRLAQNLLMTAGGFTKLADRMARAGLIDRRNSEGDRRVVYAALTDEGIRLAKEGERVYRQALEDNVLSVLDDATVSAVTDAMQQLRATHRSAAPVDGEILGARRDPEMPERRQTP